MAKKLGILDAIRKLIGEWSGRDADLARSVVETLRGAEGLELDGDNIALRSEGGLEAIGRILKQFGVSPAVFGGDPAPTVYECATIGSSSIYGCSGVLISKNVALTAGHCILGGYKKRINNGQKVRNTDTGILLFGGYSWARECTNKLICKDDIAIVFLEDGVTLSFPHLATPALLATAKLGRIVGFGGVDISGLQGTGERREGFVPVLRGAEVPASVKYDPRTELVCGTTLLTRRQDACGRDSGGAFYLWNEDDMRWDFAGIISRGTKVDPYTCGGGSIHVLVETFLGEIDRTITGTTDYLGRPMEVRQVKTA